MESFLRHSIRVIIVLSALMMTLNAEGSEPMKSLKSTENEYISQWAGVDLLVTEQKFQEALTRTTRLLETAQAERNDTEWTKALARIINFKQTLHGYEDSIRFLLETPWPDDPVARALLDLVAANAIKNYYDAYQWEIARRETVYTDDPLDIRVWTSAQIFDKARSYYADAWTRRDSLGKIPVKSFPELIQRQSYPEDMRVTLRDFLSYQWAAFCANSGTWAPKETAEVYKLPFSDWLHPGQAVYQDTIRPDTHPLAQAMQIIQDLQAWHRLSDNRPDLLETHMERLRMLGYHFSGTRQKSDIEQAWKSLIPMFKDIPWSAAATWELAGLIRNDGRLVEAFETAKQGWERFPDSRGGKLCKSLMDQLQAPRYSLENMAVDRPEARSIRISHANMKNIYFRAYRLDFDQMVQNTWQQGSGALSLRRDLCSAMIHEQKPAYQWSVDLQDPGDYADHATYSTPPMNKPGLYLIAASYRKDFAVKENRIDSVLFVVSSIVMVSTGDENRFEVQVFDADNGKPISGADVTLYLSGWRHQKKTRLDLRTDSDGRVEFTDLDNSTVFLVARKGSSVAHQHSYANSRAKPGPVTRDLIYTDRCIYRPGQTVHVKVLSFHGQDSEYNVMPDRSITLSFRDTNNELIETATLTTNQFGSASTSFTIPEGRALGIYRLKSNNGSAGVRVEEYKRPTFEVTMKRPETDVKLNHRVTISGNADYYFGMPVSDGAVTWRVVRKPRWPRWWWWRSSDSGSSQEFEVGAGESPIKPDGTFEVSFLPESDPELDKQGVTYLFEINAEVTDSGGETRNGRLGVNLGYCAVETTISSTGSSFAAEKPAEFTLTRTSLDGQPRAGKGHFRIVRLNQPDKTLSASELPIPPEELSANPLPGDALQPRWIDEPGYARRMIAWTEGAEVDVGDLTHDRDGTARYSRRLLPGAYRFHYTTQDDSGAEFATRSDFLVMNEGAVLNVPAYLLLDKTLAAAGQTLNIPPWERGIPARNTGL